jgi:SAM-dependent methyltransferase
VLDVACGTGNTALAARARGAEVTGLDLTPELLAVARERAAEEGLDGINWKEGDAENLPFPDGAFDSRCVVVRPHVRARSAEGRRRSRARDEARRPHRDPGVDARERGGAHVRGGEQYVTPPPGVPSPFEWGDEEKVQSLFGSSFKDYQFERYDCPEYADTPEQLAELFIDRYGPTNRAYHALPAEKAAAFRNDLIDLYRGYVTPADGKIRWGREYIITLAERA